MIRAFYKHRICSEKVLLCHKKLRLRLEAQTFSSAVRFAFSFKFNVFLSVPGSR